MCDINTKVNKKKVTVYKVVYKTGDGTYLSCFYEAIIKVGSTKDMLIKIPNFNNRSHILYNELMKDESLVSGFATKHGAKVLCKTHANRLVIKLVLSGNIYKGTAVGIGVHSSPHRVITYAGNYIESIKEVKI